MYGWLWRALPGPVAVRLLLLVVAGAALVALLFGVVFPAVAPLVPVNDGTVGSVGSVGSVGVARLLGGWPA